MAGSNRPKPQKPSTRTTSKNTKPSSPTSTSTFNPSSTGHKSKLPPSTLPSTTLPSSNPDHPAYDLLSRAHSPTSTSTLFTDKIRNKPLLLHPTTSSTASLTAVISSSTTQPLSNSNITSTKTPIPTDKRALRRHIRQHKQEYYLCKRKPRPLSAKEKRQSGIYKLRKGEIKYDIYRELNRLWEGYMCEILGLPPLTPETPRSGKAPAPETLHKQATSPSQLPHIIYPNPSRPTNTTTTTTTTTTTQNPPSSQNSNRTLPKISVQSHGSILSSAEYHGSSIQVVRSTDPSKVGLSGIVVRDTKYTFVLITPDNKVKTVPKRDTVFQVSVGFGGDGSGGDEEEKPRRFTFEVHGNQFEIRPPERANRKFKWRSMEHL